jgi:hypothetical protein
MAIAAMATPLILTDPGFIFWAPLLTAEPTHAAAGSTYDADVWSASWIPQGATEDGSEFTYETKIEAISVAEFFDPIRWSTTERSGSFGFNLASYTLKNLSRSLNGGAVSTVSGTGATLSSKLEPTEPGAEVRCMIGWESLDHTLRLVCRQTINGAPMKSAFKRAPSKAVIPFMMQFEVPPVGKPFTFYGAGTGRLGT